MLSDEEKSMLGKISNASMLWEENKEMRDLELALEIITTCDYIARKWKKNRKAEAANHGKTYIRRVSKVAQYQERVRHILRSAWENPYMGETLRNVVEITPPPKRNIEGLSLCEGLSAIHLKEDSFVGQQITDVLTNPPKEKPYMRFGPIMQVELHQELQILEELRRRGIRTAPIGMSTLCCLPCYTVIDYIAFLRGETFTVTGCNEKAPSNWCLPSFLGKKEDQTVRLLINAFKSKVIDECQKMDREKLEKDSTDDDDDEDFW